MESLHEQKLTFMREDMAKRGVPKSYYAPPLFKLLWACGSEIPPPIFLSSKKLFFIYSISFGVFWGFFMWLFKWRIDPQYLPVIIIPATIFAGALFGWTMTSLVRARSKKHNIPRWEDYGKSQHDLAF